MKHFIAILLFLSGPLYGVETGSAGQVFRYPNSSPTGTRPKFGSIDLSNAATVGTSIVTVTNGGAGVANAFVNGVLQAANGGTGGVQPNPPGMIFPFAGGTCPTGSIAANGASLLRAGTYANLFTTITTIWGSVDGSHFNAPGINGRMLKGAGSSSDGNGGTTVALGAYQADATAKNGLALTDPGHSHTENVSPGSNIGTGSVVVAAFAQTSTTNTGSVNTTATATTGITLAGDSETRVKAYGVTYCVWY